MGKTVILTEDSTTGFEFYKLLISLGILRCTAVYSTGFNGNSPRGKSAGYSKCLVAFENLIKYKVVNKGDTVLLAIDTLYPFNENTRMDLNVCQRQIQDVISLSIAKGINCEQLVFDCWEGLILSFKYLLEVCDSVEKVDLKYASVYIKLKERGMFDNKYIDKAVVYSRVFKDSIEKGKTVEACLAELLHVITKSEGRMFDMSKTGSIGKCWTNDCMDVKNIDREKCGTCFFVPPQNNILNGRLYTGRLRYLVNNSLLSKLFTDYIE